MQKIKILDILLCTAGFVHAQQNRTPIKRDTAKIILLGNSGQTYREGKTIDLSIHSYQQALAIKKTNNCSFKKQDPILLQQSIDFTKRGYSLFFQYVSEMEPANGKPYQHINKPYRYFNAMHSEMAKDSLNL